MCMTYLGTFTLWGAGEGGTVQIAQALISSKWSVRAPYRRTAVINQMVLPNKFIPSLLLSKC